MATKKSNTFYIGLALLAIGILSLLEILNVIRPFQEWWLPIILVIVGILVIISRKGAINIPGWICLLYGAALLLMTVGLFSLAFLWKIAPVYPLLFGLILIL